MMKNWYCMVGGAVAVLLLQLCWAISAETSTIGRVSSSSPAPAPAPAPEYVNLTDLLSVAGPFHIFLNYAETTKVIDQFQNQANNSVDGITMFVPKDSAFSSNVQQRLSNITQDQLRSLCLFHALSRYYPLSSFTNLSQQNPVPTLAGGLYTLNFTENAGTISINSGWTSTKVTSAVHAAVPVAIYEVDKVLLPEAIFGADIPPTPAPAPAPDAPTPTPAEIAPAADDNNPRPGGRNSTAHSAAPRMVLDLGLLIMFTSIVSLMFL